MKYSITFLWRLLLLWLIFFTVQRVLFLIHYFSDFEAGWGEILAVPYHALRMDLASFSYGMGIPFILLALLILCSNKIRRPITKIIHGVIWFLTLVFSIIFASELVSYTEWRTKLSSKIFVHFETPSEIFRTSSGSFTSWFIFYLIIQLVVFYLLYRYLILKIKPTDNQTPIFKKIGQFLAVFLLGGFLIGMGFRGGLQAIPISATNAYFSKHQIVNDLSVNAIWNFIHMTHQHFKKDIEGMYNRLDEVTIAEGTTSLYHYEPADTIRVLKTDRPNIIFVTLESWSAQMIGALGGEPNITPYFDELCQEGLLFTEHYATSTTSETGHTSIFSGYPTVPGISISSESAKCRQLPSIFKILKAEGYQSSYYFGGALAYGNIGGYLTEMAVDRLTDENNLDLKPEGDLGIHDEAMFPYFLNEVKAAKRPYIYGLFTQSTHAPYDMPVPLVKGYPNGSEGYVTSMIYADSVIREFTEQLKTLPDFDKTLVVFVADHGKTNYKENNVYSADFYHIPLLFWGGALKTAYKGTEVTKIGSQSDIALTLLNQMGLNTSEFRWSKNLLDPNAPAWALLTTTMSFGILDSTGYTCYHTINDAMVSSSYEDASATEAALTRSRALVEAIYKEFRNF